MERGRMTDGSRRERCEGAFRGWLLSGASAAVLLAALPALAQVPAEERVYRLEALAHAGAVEAAWRRLETWIRDESPGPAGWAGAVPPAATGWRGEWTGRGLEARYCGDTLLVYLAPAALKGVGADHRAVHAAPHAYGGGDRPVLHWLENGTAMGGEGRAAVVLPACMSAASLGGPLPSGRAALAGAVHDPFGHTVDRVTRERTVEPCPAGEHGEGRTLVREVTQTENGRGDAVGDPVEGPWQVLIELCRADYSQWEHYTLACHWDAGPPHDRRMEGREVWRRLRTVTAEGETLGPPEFVSTSCWTGDALPPPPEPEVSETARDETKSGSCPAGYTGGLSYRRTVTLRSTRFPWDEAPVTQTVRGPWVLESDDCVEEVEPDREGPVGERGGSGGASADDCGGCDAGWPGADGNVCGTGGAGGDGAGGDAGDAGDDGDCFLTTAVAARRGEADDGPTLTALRRFRDGYMTGTAERRALVAEYYAVARAIVAAIPADHADWAWIGSRIDDAVAAIDGRADDAAFGIYVDLVNRLKADWLPAGAGSDGGRP